MDLNPGANFTDLSKFLNPAPYLTPHSYIAALMVLQHQTKMHNLFTRVSYETRIAPGSQPGMNKALKRPPGENVRFNQTRIHGPSEVLIRYMLFADEPPPASMLFT